MIPRDVRQDWAFGTSDGQHPIVVAGELYGQSAAAQELERRQMEGVKRPNGNRIGLQGAREHRRRQLQQRDPRDKAPSRFSVRIR